MGTLKVPPTLPRWAPAGKARLRPATRTTGAKRAPLIRSLRAARPCLPRLPLLAMTACAHKPLSLAAAAADGRGAAPVLRAGGVRRDRQPQHRHRILRVRVPPVRRHAGRARRPGVRGARRGGGKAQVTVGRAVGAPEMLRPACSSARPPGRSPPRRVERRASAPDHLRPRWQRTMSARPRRPRAPCDRAEGARAGRAGRAPRRRQGLLPGGAGPGIAVKARAVLTLMFNRNGEVIQAQVDEAAPRHERAERCISDRAYEWQMPRPAPAGVVTASYPYTLGEDTDCPARPCAAAPRGRPLSLPLSRFAGRGRTAAVVSRRTHARHHTSRCLNARLPGP